MEVAEVGVQRAALRPQDRQLAGLVRGHQQRHASSSNSPTILVVNTLRRGSSAGVGEGAGTVGLGSGSGSPSGLHSPPRSARRPPRPRRSTTSPCRRMGKGPRRTSAAGHGSRPPVRLRAVGRHRCRHPRRNAHCTPAIRSVCRRRRRGSAFNSANRHSTSHGDITGGGRVRRRAEGRRTGRRGRGEPRRCRRTRSVPTNSGEPTVSSSIRSPKVRSAGGCHVSTAHSRSRRRG